VSDVARARSRAGWERAASGWGRWRALQQEAAAPVSAWMIEAIAPQPGHVVLEVAAGAGDTGFLAAELIRPGGHLICTDGAEAMLDVARARAAELGIENVEFTPMEAEWLDMGAASVDAILCRWGYMLLVDPESGLRDARRVLRPGGRIAIAVWDVPEANPLMTAGRAGLEAAGAAPEVVPGAPGPFALADRDAVEELLGSTGFTEIVVDAVDIVHHVASLDEAFEMQRALSPTLGAALPDLSPAEHTVLRDAMDAHLARYARPDGSLAVPGRTLVAAASA
jgi:SAM-dependent methyltransferase